MLLILLYFLSSLSEWCTFRSNFMPWSAAWFNLAVLSEFSTVLNIFIFSQDKEWLLRSSNGNLTNHIGNLIFAYKSDCISTQFMTQRAPASSWIFPPALICNLPFHIPLPPKYSSFQIFCESNPLHLSS